MADTAKLAADLDEAQAMAAKEHAEALLAERQADFDYSKTTAELAKAVAQIQVIRQLRKMRR